ncbi:ABC transporter ATP-binding protein [Chitinimonas arctica]|uniref:ABC transporter ATP-binding protein n=1 Tax=Chitinimonas arctica TaxID=2594795 RepID=A0A516SGN6_9NEIS|nr:peptide ABC transporter ATP-binding protein [Chitinimonas arctica]QDQ27323.1 ABC transporter ATP-binding protein [Chitinimonas arctica]
MANANAVTAQPELLLAKDLTRYYEVSRGFLKGHAMVKALNGVSFSLSAKKTLAVVGESGCGKSTLARQLTMIEPATSGVLSIDGVNVAQADAATVKAMRAKVQMVFQNPYASLNPRKTIAATLDEPLYINTSLSSAERMEKIKAIVAKVGLRPEHIHRYPHMFSGGQRQRIAIARAMILNPRILVADEPVSALDVSIQAQILNLFMDLQDEFETGYVFISHNLSVVEHVADDLLVMYLGATVEYGAKTTIFGKPLHPYTKALISATPAIREEDRRIQIKITGELPSPLNPPSGCTFHKRCPFATDRCKQEVPQLREIDSRMVACHHVEEINA